MRRATLSIGDVLPLDRKRGLWRGAWSPSWFIFMTVSQAEAKATHKLLANGALDCWRPTETAWRPAPRGNRAKIQYERNIAPGYLFALLDKEPHWDVLFDRFKGKLTRVVSDMHGTPLAIPERVLAEMQQVPQRIETIRQQQAEANRIKPGDRVTVLDGSMAGWCMPVERIHEGIAYFVLPILGGREVAVDEARIAKV